MDVGELFLQVPVHNDFNVYCTYSVQYLYMLY